jgi:hypothetical protein
MNMNGKHRGFILIGAMVLAFSAVASANSLGSARIKYLGSNGGRAGFKVDYDHDGTWDKTYGDSSVYVGEYNFAFDAASSSTYAQGLLSDPFYAYCIDLAQNTNGSYQTYELMDLEDAPVNGMVGPMSAAKANDLRELFGKVYWKDYTDTTGGFRGFQGGGDKAKHAFAAAMWEIIYEKTTVGYDIDSGSLTMVGMDFGSQTPSATDLANSWLAQITGDTSSYNDKVVALVHNSYQDFALSIGVSEHEFDPIPEPMTMLAVLAGGAGLGGYLRRRRLVD